MNLSFAFFFNLVGDVRVSLVHLYRIYLSIILLKYCSDLQCSIRLYVLMNVCNRLQSDIMRKLIITGWHFNFSESTACHRVLTLKIIDRCD